MKTLARILSATMAVLAMGEIVNAAPLPGFELVSQSEHFAFYSRRGRKTEAKASERFLLTTAKLMGQEPGRQQAAYYLHESADELGAATGVVTTGLTDLTSGDIHSTRSYHPHEIVHRLAAELGDPGRFFHEGLAVALGDEGKQGGQSVDTLARKAMAGLKLRSVVDQFAKVDAGAAYPVAGSFVGYLVRRHGAATVAQFFRGCEPKASVRDRRFEMVFGVSLDDAGAAWLSELGGPVEAARSTQRVASN
jgi:hypothetical protein